MLLPVLAAGCKGDGTLLDLYPMEPIVNAEIRTLIQDNRLVHVKLQGRQQISGITEKGGFTTVDKFRTFQFDSYAWPEEADVVGFGDQWIARAAASAIAFSLKLSNDNGKTWENYGGPLVDEAEANKGRVYPKQILINNNRIVWVLCQQDLGTGNRILLYRIDIQDRKSDLVFERVGFVATAIDFLADDLQGWLIGGDQHANADVRIWETIDGGQTWAVRDIPSSLTNARVVGIDTHHLMVYGAQGTSLYSADGGVTFERVTINDGEDISKIQAPTASVVYALTASGLAKSTDSGKTWLSITSETNGVAVSGFDLAFYNERQGIVYGEDRLFFTEDGGERWQILVYPYEYVFE